MSKLYKWCFLTLFLTASLFAASEMQYNLKGTVKSEDGNAIKDAIVSLAGNTTLKDTTDDNGAFSLSNITAIKFRGAFNISAEKSIGHIDIQSNFLRFNLNGAADNVSISIFSSNGKRSAFLPLGNMNAGVQKQALPELSPGFFVMNIIVDNTVVSRKLVNTGNDIFISGISAGSLNRSAGLAKIFAEGVDTLIIEKADFETVKHAVTVDADGAFIDTAIEITLKVPGPVECVPTELPESSALKENMKLPSPWEFFDGTEMTRKDEWECRRKEILAMASKYLYGPHPEEPDEVTGTVNGGTVNINCKVGSKTATFSASIEGTGDLPICYEPGTGGIFPRDYKKLTLGSGNENKIKNLYGISEINHLLADAWMIDRVMDVLELNPDGGHDPKKMMVSGCSGCGKGAFTVGLFSRIPLTVIVESGGGGAANMRMTHWMTYGGGKSSYNCKWQGSTDWPQTMDDLENNGICGPWYASTADWVRRKNENVNKLPFDTHLLLASFAPRYLCSVTNQHGVDEWCHLSGTAEILSGWAAKPVFKALGIPERMGCLMYTESGAPGHCSNPGSATDLAGEFFKRVFEGDENAKTDVCDGIKDENLQQPSSEWESMWIDWDMEKELN